MDSEFLGLTWANLDWTPFISFDSPLADWKLIPRRPGVYRVAVRGSSKLAYIGQTGRILRDRLSALRGQSLAALMPFNDPHTGACRLWSYRDADKAEFECSAAAADLPESRRKALENYLLWLYRLKTGESTSCNFGRLHQNYIPSRNTSSGFRGQRLQGVAINPGWAASLPPLQPFGTCRETQWMGLNWSEFLQLRADVVRSAKLPFAGFYRLASNEGDRLFYIGESESLKKRLVSHAAGLSSLNLVFSVTTLDTATAKCQRLEIESDLIGSYFSEHKIAPDFQFRSELPATY